MKVVEPSFPPWGDPDFVATVVNALALIGPKLEEAYAARQPDELVLLGVGLQAAEAPWVVLEVKLKTLHRSRMQQVEILWPGAGILEAWDLHWGTENRPLVVLTYAGDESGMAVISRTGILAHA